MREPRAAAAIFLLILILVGGVTAQTEVEISGQVRFRSTYNHLSFNAGDDVRYGTILRSRVTVEAFKDSNALAFVQFQDSRELGAKDKFGEWQSGTTNDGEGVDVHQAYVEVDRIWTDGLGLKVGRFELNLGNQRVFGADDWDNVGLSWEGARLRYRFGPRRISTFWLVPRIQYEGERSTSLFGLHFRCEKSNLELMGFYEYDRDTTGLEYIENDDMDRYTLALYWQGRRNNFDLEVNGAYQTGTKGEDTDIRAFMFTAEAGLSFGEDNRHRIAAGIDYSSGDDDPYDDVDRTYDNLYYSRHDFRGYMDYFRNSDDPGLIDLMLRGRLAFAPEWVARGDLHYFKTTTEYSYSYSYSYGPELDPSTTNVGVEFDFNLNTTSVAGVDFNTGFSVFFPDETFARSRLGYYTGQTVEDPTYWSYAQASVSF